MPRHPLRSLLLTVCAGGLSVAVAPPATAQGRIAQGDRLITYQLAPGAEGAGLQARFQVELRDRNLLDPTGGRSIAGEAWLNCQAGLSRLESMTVYAQPKLGGAVVRRAERQTAWLRPEMGSLVRALLIDACKTPAATASAAPRPAFVRGLPTTVEATPQAEAASVAPAPTTLVAPPIAAPPSTPSLVDARPASAGSHRVQVGSFPSAAEAETHAARVRASASDLPAPRLEAARVGAATYHRVLIDGFGSRAEANAACRRFAAAGLPCLVKAARPTP